MRSDDDDEGAVRKLNVDVDLLAEAMSRGDDDPFEHYLDIETGELIEVPGESGDFDLDDDELRAERARIDDAPTGRFARVPTVETRDAYRRMERFAASLSDVDDRDELLRAIAGKGAFRRFRDLTAELKLVDRWRAFEAAAMEIDARDWLATLGIEAPPSSRKRPEPPPVAAAPTTIDVLDLVLLGAPDGKTELLDGGVYRIVRAKDASDARALFKSLARSICAYVGEPWRRRFLDAAATTFMRDRFVLSIEDNVIELKIVVDRATWERFR
jgi:hypothetical protein